MPDPTPEPAAAEPVHVMVAVIRNHRDETLVALRAKDTHQGGLWEFPGGKREPGEPPVQALHRELYEEIGLRILASHPLCAVEHRYSDKHVRLDVRLVSRWSGTPICPEGCPEGTPTRRRLRRNSGTPTPREERLPGTPTGRRLLGTPTRPKDRPDGTPIAIDPAGTPIGDPTGTPIGREGQPIAWRARHELFEADFPAANARIVRLLRLPGAITITPDCADKREFLELMRKQIKSGRELVQVRQPQLSPKRYQDWFRQALEMAKGSPTRLLFNNPPEFFNPAWPGCGFHASGRVLEELVRRPAPVERLFSASCHSLTDLHRAEALGADFAFLSPVSPTSKYADCDLLGWRGFQRLADRVSLPVYALGGMHPAQAQFARGKGAFGVAGTRRFT